MNSQPEIDVVLLSWNRAEMTLATLENLLAQQAVALNIWVVDQGSRPEELAKLENFSRDYPEVHLIPLGENRGVPAGRNMGTRMGRAKYVVSIDNDAVFESPNALRDAVQVLEERPSVAVISFRIKNFFTHQDDELSWVYPKRLKLCRDQELIVTRFVGCGHIMRRDAFEAVGGYDDHLFFYWEEVDLSYRLINHNYQLLYLPRVVVLHKVAAEARVRWEDKRFYFLVRNAIYIYLKYNSNLLKSLLPACGYLMKGFYNQLPRQAIKGMVDGYRMYFERAQRLQDPKTRLSRGAHQYIQDYELCYRGSFWDRVRTEVLTELPGRR